MATASRVVELPACLIGLLVVAGEAGLLAVRTDEEAHLALARPVGPLAVRLLLA
jgi:hypothetical protein